MTRALRIRFWNRVNKDGPIPSYRPELGKCWLWVGGLNWAGYGVFYINRSPKKAHRIMYQLLKGTVPSGLELDHLCRNRACVNPSHLETVTHRVNTLRGLAPSALCAQKTHCLNGHAFTPANTWVDKEGKRNCRICRRAATDRWMSSIGAERKEELREYHKQYRRKHRAKIIAYLREYRRKQKGEIKCQSLA